MEVLLTINLSVSTDRVMSDYPEKSKTNLRFVKCLSCVTYLPIPIFIFM